MLTCDDPQLGVEIDDSLISGDPQQVNTFGQACSGEKLLDCSACIVNECYKL